MIMKKVLFLLSFISLGLFAYGQDSNDALLKKLVEKNIITQAEADSLSLFASEEKKSNVSSKNTLEKIKEAVNSPALQLGGYSLFMYKYSDLENVKHSAEPRVVFLSLKGEPIKNFKYCVFADLAHATIYEFYGEWTPSAAFNVRIGQAKTPLSIENQLSLTAIEGVLNTRSISALMGMKDDVMYLQDKISSAGRDIGVKIYGELIKTKTHNLLGYDIGLYQGTGLNTKDNNNTKDFAANVLLQPIKGFRIGGGAYFGQATYLKPGDLEVSDHVRNRWILSSDYKFDQFYARLEWIKGNDGGINKEGLNGMGMYYFIPSKFNSFAKVDYLNQDKSTNNELMEYTVGVNYYFYKTCRLQLNYTYTDYSKKWGARDSNVVIAQLQIVY